MRTKEAHTSLSVYLNLADGSWRATKRLNHNPVSCDIDERDKELALAICKSFAIGEGSLFHGPKYLFLPSGIYQQNGSGYNFVSNERDVGYTKLTKKETELLLNYDCKTVWERIADWMDRKKNKLKFTMSSMFSHNHFGADASEDAMAPLPAEPQNKETTSATQP